MKWTEARHINPMTHPDTGLGDHNYCRNPDNDHSPWCWVDIQPDSQTYRYCIGIPQCGGDGSTTMSVTGALQESCLSPFFWNCGQFVVNF